MYAHPSPPDADPPFGESVVRAVLADLGVERVQSYGADNWLISAPYRADRHPSCSVHRARGLWNDKATGEGGSLFDLIMRTRGCDFAEAAELVARHGGPTRRAEALNGTQRRPASGRPSHIVAEYPYHAADGTLLYTVRRTADKQFFPTQPDGAKGYGGPRVLYRLPELLAAPAGQVVLVVEGEKDVDTLRALGLPATTSPGGARSWRPEYAAWLRERRVAIIPDHDEPGWAYALTVAHSLTELAAELRVVELPWEMPRLPTHGPDVSDWLQAGHTCEELLDCIAATKPGVLEPAPTVADGGWGLRYALPTRPPSSELEAELLPEALRGWLCEEARRISAPLASVAAPAVVALGSLIGRRLALAPTGWGDFVVVPNLWGMDVAPPGDMKTDRARAGLTFLRELAAQAQAEYAAAEADRELALEELDAALKAARQLMTEAAKQHDTLKLRQAQAEIMDANERRDALMTPEPRLIVQDPTVEKLGELLRDNPCGLLLYRDELSGFFRSLEKQGREGDQEFYLEAWNGTGGYSVDRVSRGTLHIPALCLSIYGTIQPDTLRGHLRKALRDDGAGDGFLQRFQLLIYADRPPWQPPRMAPDQRAAERARRVYRQLAALDGEALGAPLSSSRLPYLTFTAPAQQTFDDWRGALEARLSSDALAARPAFASHLAKYRSLAPALALIFHLVDWADAGAAGLPDPIGETDLARALGWVAFLEHHAHRVYETELADQNPAVTSLAQRIEEGRVPDGILLRDLARRHWSNLRTRQDVDAALEVLTEANWLRVVDELGRNQQPVRRVRLHPDFHR